MTARLEAFRKPVIAAVNGLAFGGGCEITEAVHLAIASERAQVRQTGNQSGHAADLRRDAAAAAARRAQARARTAADGRSVLAGAGAGDRTGQQGRAASCSCCRPRANWPARIVRHSPLAVGGIITAVTRGLNMTHRRRAAGRERAIRRARADQRSRRRHQCLDRAPSAGLYRPLTPGVISLPERFPAKGCPGLDPGWRPVLAKKTRQIKKSGRT